MEINKKIIDIKKIIDEKTYSTDIAEKEISDLFKQLQIAPSWGEAVGSRDEGRWTRDCIEVRKRSTNIRSRKVTELCTGNKLFTIIVK